jgi:Uma2 family endonuclease
MSATPALVLEEDLVIPAEVYDLPRFRRWSQSEPFPEHGRIDYLDGRVEVDLSPEDVHAHATVKTEISRVLSSLVWLPQLGLVLIDSSRIVSPKAGLSVEPDIVVAMHASFEAGRIREVPSARKAGRSVELEGAADLIVEVLSDSSEKKDRQRLPPLYAKAGVPELWLVDVRKEDRVDFEIHALTPSGYAVKSPDTEGWVASPVLGLDFRLVRSVGPRGVPHYELQQRLA